MKSFSNTMAEDNYNTSQSNLNATSEQQPQAELRRQASQQSNELLAPGARSARTTRIADEMSTDLQYLSREAPLDGGESTFGAYSTLGGGHSSQQLAPGDDELIERPGAGSQVLHETSYRSSTMTRTSTTPIGDHDGGGQPLSDDEGHQRLENDYERTDFRIDADDDDATTQVYQYNQRMRPESAGGRNSFGDPQQQLEQLAPDNVDIQRPLQQAGSESSLGLALEPNTTSDEPNWELAGAIGGKCSDSSDAAVVAVGQQQEQLERLAEVSRLGEIEHRDLDNAPSEGDRQEQPIQMVVGDSLESERTMAECEAGQPFEQVGGETTTPANLNAANLPEWSDRQQAPNLQPVNFSTLLKPFLVSFMVDARGGAMRGCRHSGVRVIIPPNTAPQPMRITCRYLRRERLVHPPPLMEGEACASKIMEVGPAGARFLGPVLIEVPHFASLRGKEREIIILRSDSGEVWREHLFETDDQLIESIIGAAELVEQQQNPYATGQDQDQDQENQRPSSAIGQSSQKSDFGGGGGGDVQQERRLTRIVTNEFPQYFAIISRVRQEVHTVGPDGLAVDSQVVPRVQAIFTDGALTKRIKIGLQKKEGATPEPQQQAAEPQQGEAPADIVQERNARSPSRPSSAQAKRRSRFLACFGASHGSHDLLDQSGTDAEGFASGSNESSSSSGGDSPRQLANEKLIERRHIIEDLTDSEADEPKSPLGGGGGGISSRKKRSATGSQLVPEDYYIEPEPAFILNLRPKTYGKRLQSSSAQTDQKLNGHLSTSARSPKRRGVNNLLSAAKRRRNKTQMQIPFHEPRPSSQRAASRAKSLEVVDSSLESQLETDDLNQDELDSADEKWRTCTIQTDSDSVTVQYVTISNATMPIEQQQQQAAAVKVDSKATATSGQDDGYVSGSGELKRAAGATDQTSAKTGLKTNLFLPFCSTSSAAEDDDEDDHKGQADKKAEHKLKKSAKKEKKTKSKESGGGSGKSSPVKLDVVPEVEVDEAKAVIETDAAEAQPRQDSQQEPSGPVEAAQLSAGEEADELLLTTTTTTTTSRSISPTSKEQKQRLKLEKREKLKREKLERQRQKELEEANTKAAKAQKKLEKEAKKKAEKEEKLAKKTAAEVSKQQSPDQSRAQSPSGEQVAKQEEGGVLGTITRTIQSVKFAPSPSKDSLKEAAPGHEAAPGNQQDEIEDSSMVHVSIGTDSNLLAEDGTTKPEATSGADQLISFTPEPTESASSELQPKVLKPILKQQQSSSIERDVWREGTDLSATDMAEVIGDKLVDEATQEAVEAIGALQSSAASSPATSPSSSSESKKEAAKRLKAEKDKLKAELKLSVDEEKRLAKEAKRLAKQAEEAAKRAEREAKKAAFEAQEEAERQADIAKREAEAAMKLIESPQKQSEEESHQVASESSEPKSDKAELRRQAKEAELEAKRQAKEAKKRAKEAAAQEKAKLKAEKKRAKVGAEPSAPSLEMISESSPEAHSKSSSSSAPTIEQSEAVVPVDESKSVPLGLPRVSFDLSRSGPVVKPIDEVVDEQVATAADEKHVEQVAESAEQVVEPESVDKSEATLVESEAVSKSSADSKKSKKKDKKKSKKEKQGSNSDESSSGDAVSKSSGSFFGRLFKSKHKQKQPQDESAQQEQSPEQQQVPPQAVASTEHGVDQDSMLKMHQNMIVSEMYPSDPNNADGEMILEVNVPEELISEASRKVPPVESSRQQEGGQVTSGSAVASASNLETTEPTDDQEATLVNLSQMKDDVNEDVDDDEATENVLSQANDLVEEVPQSQPEQTAETSSPIAQLVEPERPSDEVHKFSEPAQADLSQQQQVASEEPPVEVGVAPQQVASSSGAASKELAKDEKARKELEAKLEKEAKKRAKEEEKERKRQEKADKKRAESEAKKQAQEERERKKREAKEAKKAAEQAKKEAKKADKRKKSADEKTAASGAPEEPSGSGDADGGNDENRPTTITTTTITSTSTTAGNELALNDNIGQDCAAHDDEATGRVIMSSVSETPINEETEVERIVEEVVGEDGTVTKTTKLVETKYVTMRQEEIRVAERRDIPLEEWNRLQAERASTSGDGQLIERVALSQPEESAESVVRSAELEEICATPSYFDLTSRPAEIKPETSEKKALKKRIKLNQKLIKRAHKLAKCEFKKARQDQRRAEAEIAVCHQAARQAKKELKSAVEEAKRAAKLTQKQHKKMDKVDKQLSKRAKELEKRQKKLDKQLAKAAKKQAKREAKAAKKAAKLVRSNSSKSGSSRSPSRSSKRSLRPEDIGEPVLRSSSRLSIVQSNPNVELSVQQPVELTPERTLQVETEVEMHVEQPIELSLVEGVVGDGETIEANRIEMASPEAEAMRTELDAAREEEEDAVINVVDVDDDDEGENEPHQASGSPESNTAELEETVAAATESVSPSSGGGKGKKNKKRNKKQKSRESAE